jgi:phosphoserine phosphatase RsbU/P
MAALRTHLRELWRRASRVDLFALGILLGGATAALFVRASRAGGVLSFLKFLAALAALYFLFRLLGWWRGRLLWSLRNRLIVAYVFMALVPVILISTLGILGAQILYSQLGAYLIYEDVQHRVEMLNDSAEHIAAAEAALPGSIPDAVQEQILEAQAHAAHDQELPELKVSFHGDTAFLERVAGRGSNAFAGIVQSKNQLTLVALRRTQSARGPAVIELSVPVSPEFLERVAPDLGPVQITIAQRVDGASLRDSVKIGDAEYRPVGHIHTRRRLLQPGTSWFDPPVEGFSKLDATYLEADGRTERNHPVFAFFSARPSQLNHRIFSSLGDISRLKIISLQFIAVVLLLIEVAALITGVILTRAITRAVAELYGATQYVQAGDLSHRVRIERRDQLGVLGESFNLMTGSISNLIEEQKRRQRLENELSIAREVQAQLFPRNLPAVRGVELEATCRAARVVSGDYYDFIPLGPTRLGMAIADISGKGISAALLMASLQAALRSQALARGAEEESTAELVGRLNRHVVRNTGDDRFATFFYAVYDSSTRLLRYTNAGHLPSFLVSEGKCHRLEAGGMVLGVVEDYVYEQGIIEVAPDSLLVGYSDGLIEPENVFGEEFGIDRLEEVTLRLRHAPPAVIAETLMTAVDEWAGAPEQADDMTVIVARLS